MAGEIIGNVIQDPATAIAGHAQEGGAIAMVNLAELTFDKPALAGLAVAGISAYLAFDLRAARRNKNAGGVPIADPESASIARADGRFTRRTNRSMGYFGAVFLSALAAHQADPHISTTEVSGSASVVLTANYKAGVEDMTHDGREVSRAEASLEGTLAAAREIDAPLNLILNGKSPQIAGTVQTGSKETGDVRKKAIEILQSPVFRNGSSIGESAEQAASLEEGPNNIIVIGSNATGPEVSLLSRLARRIKRSKKGDTLNAIVVGEPGSAKTEVASLELKSPVETGDFKEAIGGNNVTTATSSEQVEKAIENIMSKTTTNERREPFNGFLDLAIVSALLGGVAGVGRRFPGSLRIISKLLRIRRS